MRVLDFRYVCTKLRASQPMLLERDGGNKSRSTSRQSLAIGSWSHYYMSRPPNMRDGLNLTEGRPYDLRT